MTTEKISELVDGLASDLKSEVAKIESGIKTTQNNYGKYMNLISMLSKGNKNMAIILAMAFKKAGANVLGVNSAMRVLGYGSN